MYIMNAITIIMNIARKLRNGTVKLNKLKLKSEINILSDKHLYLKQGIKAMLTF